MYFVAALGAFFYFFGKRVDSHALVRVLRNGNTYFHAVLGAGASNKAHCQYAGSKKSAKFHCIFSKDVIRVENSTRLYFAHRVRIFTDVGAHNIFKAGVRIQAQRISAGRGDTCRPRRYDTFYSRVYLPAKQ